MAEAVFTPAKFIETPDGDFIAPDQISDVRYWPATSYTKDHRAQLCTVKGAVLELYRGPSADEAIAARDKVKAMIRAAIEFPKMAH